MNFFKAPTSIVNFNESFKNTKVLHIKKPQDLEGELDLYYKKLAASAGFPIIYREDPVSGIIEENKWSEIKYNKSYNNKRFRYSNTSQPLHTDFSYLQIDFFASFFFCIKQADFGGATTFIDVDKIVEILKNIDINLFDELLKTKILFGRGDNGLTIREDYILSKDEIGWRINWNYFRVNFTSDKNKLAIRFKNFLDTRIEKSGELHEIKLKPGEAVFFHDRRVLHGRNSFIGERCLNKGAIALNLPESIANILS